MKTKEELQQEIEQLQKELKKLENEDMLKLNDEVEAYICCRSFVDGLIEDINNGEYDDNDDRNQRCFEAICKAVYPNFFEWFNKNT